MNLRNFTFRIKRESLFVPLEDPDSKYDVQLEDFAKGVPLSKKIINNCKKMKKSERCSFLTKSALYIGGVLQAVFVWIMALANISSLTLTSQQSVIIIVSLGCTIGVLLCLVSSLTTGCFPDCSSDLANIKQDSFSKLKAHFSHLAWRITRRYYEFEQDEAMEISKKILKNFLSLTDAMSYYISVHDANDITDDLFQAVNYIQAETEDEKKRILKEWKNEEIKSYITSQIELHNLKLMIKQLNMAVTEIQDRLGDKRDKEQINDLGRPINEEPEKK